MGENDVRSVTALGRRFSETAHLKLRPLCVFESEKVPEGSKPFGSVDRCLAKAVFICASGGTGTLHIGRDAKDGVCPGGQCWTGLTEMAEGLKYFISTGTPSFRNGAAEYLKRDPEMVVASRSRVGLVRPPENYLCVTPCEDFRDHMGKARSILLFSGAEQTRNILALRHFGTPEVFTSAGAPWGPSCASFMSYPAGLSTNCPDNLIVIGPVDPTGNSWLPPDIMSLGIPLKVAKEMVSDLNGSFLIKRPKVAFPDR